MDNNLFRYKLNIYLMYAYSFFHSLIFAYVIERLYWASRGITSQQVVYIEIIYAAVVILLEVPTGSLADKWSKKILMVFHAVFSLLEFIILIYAHSFWHFALAVTMAGIGKSLCSGTSNALVFESLKMNRDTECFERVLGRIGFYDYFAAMLAALLGSFVAAKSSYITTYWMSLISVMISVIIACFFKEPKAAYEKEEVISYFRHMAAAFNFLKDKSAIKFILFFGIVTGAVFTYIDEFWQTYLQAINVPVILFGVISASRMISSSLSGIYAYKLKNKFSNKTIFSTVIIVLLSSIFGASVLKTSLGIIPLIISFAAYGVVEPLVLGYLHHRTESKIRATVESFQSLALRVFTIICGLFFGYFATNYSIFIGFRFLAFSLIAYFIYFTIKQNKDIEFE
ncbi:MFS transporter [Clostridium sp. YIM B02515]|uniref:MFS transporter n=1 Tax=Clostridium rhizosphaerae TaxID=2803861 RepID=A0ABS1TI68_9CLOT|nr:MFS transporter [Clostridium rhizosphaerae]MBL4938482.1 MFS transporter [Clostridium rhizosphaerae]